MKNKIFCLLFFSLSFTSKAQNKTWYYVAGLSGASAILYADFAKNEQKRIYQEHFAGFHTRADDVIQYSPAILNIGLHLVGIPASDGGKDHVGKFLLGAGTFAIITKSLKYAFNETRPDGADHSFPSGHTTNAFFGARMLDKAYGKKYPFIAVAGYTLATATGALRMANNKHWASDVAMGAAIGIASAEFAHWAYPKLKKSLDKNTIAWEPIVSPNFYAARLSYSF
jgi:hypothetical protein